MFACGKEFDTLRYNLEDNRGLSYRAIMAKYVAHEERYKLRAADQQTPGPGRDGRRPRGPRGTPAAAGAGSSTPVALAVVEADAVCRHCKKKGHFQRNCPDLDPVVRKFLQGKAEERKASGARGRCK